MVLQRLWWLGHMPQDSSSRDRWRLLLAWSVSGALMARYVCPIGAGLPGLLAGIAAVLAAGGAASGGAA
jgi:hypothetical protein